MSFEVDLRNQVPMYGTENPNWGGAACVQMAMNGYPPSATSCFIDQTTIWNYIQAHNKEGGTGPWGIGWYSDPYAVTKALNDLCPPQHHWVDVSGTDKNTVLYTLLRWMANYKYASLVCTYIHDYWDLMVYYKTSADPRQQTNPTLERIGFYTPYISQWTGPQCNYEELDGPLWLDGFYYWLFPCDDGYGTPDTCGVLWDNKWVAIGEPPETKGSVKIEKIVRTGKELIKPIEAAEIARRFLDVRRREKSEFLLRRLTGLQAAQPMLVRELPSLLAKQKTKADIHYYIVPFVNRYEVNQTEAPKARLSVLVNAYTGRFEEMCIFSQPLHYLSEREVSTLVRKTLHLNRREARTVQTELVFTPMQIRMSSAMPAWKVTVANRTFYVTHTGLVMGGRYLCSYRGG